jgi:glycine oxidase
MNVSKKNIAVLGAGVLGLSAAAALSKAGHKVSLFDGRGFPPDIINASAKAGGMLAPYSEIEHMSGEWIKAALHSIEIWRDFKPHDTGFQQNGSLLIAHPADKYILERFQTHLTSHAPHSLTLGLASIYEPLLEGRFENGIFLEQEAHINPALAMKMLMLRFEGEKIFKNETPEHLKSDYDFVIDCRGMGAAFTTADLRGVKGETALVHNTEFSLSRPVRLMHPRYPLYIIPRPDNLFMIGATVIESQSDETVSLKSSMELMSALYTLHPSFGEAKIVEFSAGIRPSYSDNLPRIDCHDNVIACNGLFRHGYFLAPVMAECVLNHIHGQDNPYWKLFNKNHDDKTDHQRAA